MLEQEDCHAVLENFLKNKEYKLESFEVLTFRNPLQGLVGDHYTLRIKYYADNNELKTQDFFLKTMSTNPLMIEFSKEILVYEKEEFFYKYLIAEYEKYEIDVSFAPRGYFFKPYVTVLEDLSESGYRGTPKRQLLDFEHCKICIETIAKFHGAAIIYEKKKSEELGRNFCLKDEFGDILENKVSNTKGDNIAARWLQSCIEGLFVLIDLVPENHVTHDEFKEKLGEILLEIENRPDSLISGTIHADLWTSNFLYIYENGKPLQCKLLDYQVLQYGPLEQDLLEFFMKNTTRHFRDKHFNELIEHYHENLCELLLKAGLDCDKILANSKEFLRSCDNFKLLGKLHAIVDHSFTFVSDEIYGDAMKSEESSRKFFFEERGKSIIESYNKNKEFRNVLSEDIIELRDLLFPK